MTTDERLHYLAGFIKGTFWRFLSKAKTLEKIRELDIWAWNREWAQNLKGDTVNDIMSDHQVSEARAWGRGARDAAGLNPPYPVPPYYTE